MPWGEDGVLEAVLEWTGRAFAMGWHATAAAPDGHDGELQS